MLFPQINIGFFGEKVNKKQKSVSISCPERLPEREEDLPIVRRRYILIPKRCLLWDENGS